MKQPNATREARATIRAANIARDPRLKVAYAYEDAYRAANPGRAAPIIMFTGSQNHLFSLRVGGRGYTAATLLRMADGLKGVAR